MTDSSGAIKVRVPKYKMEGDYQAPPLNGGAPGSPGLAPDELSLVTRRPNEPRGPTGRPLGDTSHIPAESDNLIAAIAKVHRAVTAKIAWHERELKKLRAALAPFGAMSTTRHNDAPEDGASSAAVDAILSHLEKVLPTGESQP